MPAQFVIGIDLGTTNSVLSYASLDQEHPEIELLEIPQLVSGGTTESFNSLASFAYIANDAETSDGSLNLPWSDEQNFAVGEYARRRSAEAADRTVGAAKSWLCNASVDRRQPILPWNAPDEIEKMSPVTASQRYLEHLVAAWENAFPGAPITEQQVVLTVPASFDPVARELTREAALAAGLPPEFVLLEEPQAALYAWLHESGDQWRKIVGVGESVLVCDIGGGTTDLTLVTVGEEEGELVLQRAAVGEHLLVGGDNMDLAIAHHVSAEFAKQGTKLNPWQSVSLWHSCRTAKETLLDEDGDDSYTISILGRGSKLIGGTVKTEVARKKIAKLLVDGFLPDCSLTEKPQRQPASGFQELGLAYESDPAITRHIASFLNTHCGGDSSAQLPKHVLFNGGVFKAAGFQKRLLDVLGSWAKDDGSEKPKTLSGVHDLDHAVARGSCYYAWTKQHGGMRIRGGVAASYYVGIETAGLAIPGAPRPLKALCVVPFGMEEGTQVDVPSGEIGLVLGQPTSFRFFSSHIRKDDQPGTLVDSWDDDELLETDPLEATLPARDKDADTESHVPVKFEAHVTELGMFELWCGSTKSDDRWKLEFNVREE